MSEEITFVCITQNREANLRKNLPVVLPYVDKAVIIDGGSEDGTEEYLKSLAPKVKYVYRKWDDSFKNQYSAWIKHVHGGWVLICDDDELPSIPMLEKLRMLIEDSKNGEQYSVVKFQAISQDPSTGWESKPTKYYREMFFKWTPHLHYVRDPHQSLRGYLNGRMIRCNEVYYHYKDQNQNFYNACRNYWIAGVWLAEGSMDGARGDDWHSLKAIVAEEYPDVEVYRDLDKIMRQGNIHPRLKAWMKKWKDHADPRYHELRLWHEYYFEYLHPEEDV